MDVYFTPLATVVCGVHVPVSLCLIFSLGMWPRMSSARPPGQTRRLAPTGNIGRGKQASAGGRAPGGRKSRGSHRAVKSAHPWPLSGSASMPAEAAPLLTAR